MAGAVERLTKLVRADERFAIPHAELRDVQVEAMNERFQERQGADQAARPPSEGSRHRRDPSRATTMVPLLFPHSVYKSYPESFLTEQKWDRLAKWLGTVSPYPIAPIETSDIVDIDDWIARLEAKGHYVSCSSGTTGKSAMLIASEQDMEWSRVDTVGRVLLGIRRRAGAGPPDVRRRPDRLRRRRTAPSREAQAAAFGDPRYEPIRLAVPPITVGQLTKMVVLRKAMAEGTARPEEIADFEATSKEREETLDKAYVIDGGAARRRPGREAVRRRAVERAVPRGQARPRDGLQRRATSIPTTASTSAVA